MTRLWNWIGGDAPNFLLISGTLSFATGFLALQFGLALLIGSRSASRRALGGAYISMAAFQMIDLEWEAQSSIGWLALQAVDLLAAYACSAFFLVYVKLLSSDARRETGDLAVYFVPGLLIAALTLAPIVFTTGKEHNVLLHELALFSTRALALANLAMSLFISASFFIRLNASDQARASRMGVVLLTAGLALLLAAAAVTSAISNNLVLSELTKIGFLPLLATLHSVVWQRGEEHGPVPRIDSPLQTEAESENAAEALSPPQKVSILSAETRLQIRQTLRELIEEQRIYLVEDLRLAQLADEIGVTVHQLSAYINDTYEVNFNTFINTYRIEAACRMLVDEPERNIASVSEATGFNSLASFHRAFARETGLTPGTYRQNATLNRS